MGIKEEPTLDYTVEHVKNYLEGRIDIREFWEPFPDILEFYHSYPEDPSHRLSYFWRRNSLNVHEIVRFGHAEEEPGYREYLTLWLDALQRPEDEWQKSVKHKGWALDETDPGWDK